MSDGSKNLLFLVTVIFRVICVAKIESSVFCNEINKKGVALEFDF